MNPFDEHGAGTWSTARNAVRTVVTLPIFVVDHAWRSRIVERSHTHVDALSEPPPPHRPHPHLQSRDDGTGPIVMRTYRVDIADPVLDAAALIDDFRTDPNHFNSSLVAGFVRDDRPVRHLDVDDELVVEIPGPWNGPCTVDQIDANTVLLATLEGHMEAGHIRFRTTETGTELSFEIRSWARAGDEAFAALHLVVPVGRELQTAMWCAMCERAVAISGGTRRGPIRVSTEVLNDSEQD